MPYNINKVLRIVFRRDNLECMHLYEVLIADIIGWCETNQYNADHILNYLEYNDLKYDKQLIFKFSQALIDNEIRNKKHFQEIKIINLNLEL